MNHNHRVSLGFALVVLAGLIATACSSSTSPIATDSAPVASSVGPDPSPPETTTPPTTWPPRDSIDTDVEAQSIPYAECHEVAENGPPESDEMIRLQRLRAELEAEGLFDQPFVGSSGGPESVWGILSIGLRRRYQPTIDWLASRVDVADVCLELPPVGYYRRPFEAAVWEVGPDPDRQDREIPLSVNSANGGCGYNPAGRILDPIVVYGETTIEVTIPLDHVSWGGHTCEGWGPTAYRLVLSEDQAGRELVVGAPPS